MEFHEFLKIDYDIFLRLFFAVLLGFAIGLERELTNKYAGLRTHLLVCIGSCVFTILSIYAFPMAVETSNPQGYGDPARIAAQILTGIGFIGGGTVLRHGNSVSGLTTAATLWVAASIGMACGTARFDIAILATLISVLILVVIRYFEKNVLLSSTKNLKIIQLKITYDKKNSEKINNYIIGNVQKVVEIKEKQGDSTNEITAKIETHVNNAIKILYKNFYKLNLTDTVSIEEINDA